MNFYEKMVFQAHEMVQKGFLSPVNPPYSFFVWTIMKRAGFKYEIENPQKVENLLPLGKKVESPCPGDMVVFQSPLGLPVGEREMGEEVNYHIGIMIDEIRFIHYSPSHYRPVISVLDGFWSDNLEMFLRLGGDMGEKREERGEKREERGEKREERGEDPDKPGKGSRVSEVHIPPQVQTEEIGSGGENTACDEKNWLIKISYPYPNSTIPLMSQEEGETLISRLDISLSDEKGKEIRVCSHPFQHAPALCIANRYYPIKSLEITINYYK